MDEVSEGVFDEFVVLLENADDGSASLFGVSLQSAAKSDVVCVRLYLPSQFMKILYVRRSRILLS